MALQYGSKRPCRGHRLERNLVAPSAESDEHNAGVLPPRPVERAAWHTYRVWPHVARRHFKRGMNAAYRATICSSRGRNRRSWGDGGRTPRSPVRSPPFPGWLTATSVRSRPQPEVGYRAAGSQMPAGHPGHHFIRNTSNTACSKQFTPSACVYPRSNTRTRGRRHPSLYPRRSGRTAQASTERVPGHDTRRRAPDRHGRSAPSA